MTASTSRQADKYQGYYMVEMWSNPYEDVRNWLASRCGEDPEAYFVSGRRIYIKDERIYTMFILSWS